MNNGYVTWITPDAKGLLDLEPWYHTFFFSLPLFATTLLEFALDWNRLEGRRLTKLESNSVPPLGRLDYMRLD